MLVKWIIQETDNFSILNFTITNDGILEPNDLKTIKLPINKLNKGKGLILAGRAPIWFYTFLTHCAHPFAWVAIFDTHLNEAVVIERHTKTAPLIGDTIKLSEIKRNTKLKLL